MDYLRCLKYELVLCQFVLMLSNLDIIGDANLIDEYRRLAFIGSW